MTNEEILANAPEGATHITSNNVYLKVYGNHCHVFNSLHVWSIPITNIEDVFIRNNPRSLSDIRRIVELEKYNLGLATESHELQQKLEAAEQALKSAEDRVDAYKLHVDEMRETQFRRFNNEECWIYQGDGEDYPESLICPVVISAEQLRTFLAAERERDEANRSLHYVKERNKQIEQLYKRNDEALCKLIDELSQSNSRIKEFKAALSKIHGECIDVLFDFAARRDDRRLALPIHQQAPEVQEAIAVFEQLIQQLNGGE